MAEEHIGIGPLQQIKEFRSEAFPLICLCITIQRFGHAAGDPPNIAVFVKVAHQRAA